MLHLRAQIKGLYSKTEGSLFWEEGKAIFCTRHEESFDFILHFVFVFVGKSTGSEISYGRLNIVTVCLVPEPEREMALGAAALQNCWC